ncbi:MAG: Uma2 family endonuclease [Phormidesmis sp.]
MTQAKLRFLDFEQYLSYEDDTEKLYELFNGELVEVPPESGLNLGIAGFLFLKFAAIIDHLQVRGHGLELEVRGEPKNRYPDLTIIREEHVHLIDRRSTIRLTMPPPLLVVEVVSPGGIQRDRDYIAKRGQYEDIDIGEYWIVDPLLKQITVLSLQEGSYAELGIFRDQQVVQSPTFPELAIAANTILSAGKS